MLNHTTILVLGAGQLGMAMLRALAPRARQAGDVSLSVLLRPSSAASDDLARPVSYTHLRAHET